LLTLDRLEQAWGQVKKGSQSAGVDGVTPVVFKGNSARELPRLLEQLEQHCYLPKPARGLWIKSGRRRLVAISTVRDRIVQRSLLDELNPVLESLFCPISYAYRPGFSVNRAIADFTAATQEKISWVLQVDVQAFFDRICWPILFTKLEQLPMRSLGGAKLAPEIVRLVKQQVKQAVVLQSQVQQRSEGLLQGSALSGALANLYLDDLDWRCWKLDLPCVRYGDDMAFLCGSQQECETVLSLLRRWLGELYLRLQPDKTCITSPGQSYVLLGHRICDGRVVELLKDWRPYERRRLMSQPVKRPIKTQVLQAFGGRQVPMVISAANVPQIHYWSKAMTTLYVTDQGACLRMKNQQFQVVRGESLLCEVPAECVSHVVLFGCCNVTHGAAKLALHRGIPVMYLSQRGRYYGRLETAGLADVEVLSRQVICSQDMELGRKIAEVLVMGKLHNSKILLQRLERRHENKVAQKVLKELTALMRIVSRAGSLEALRGYEGQGAKIYFRGFASFLAEPFRFEGRSTRPPQDAVNSLMSLGYTLLHQNMNSCVLGLGLHTHFGHLHTPRKDHPALVLDLVEEFRAPVVDSFVMYLVNSRVVALEDFTTPDEDGGVYLLPDALKVFLKHWEDRMHLLVTHPHTGLKVPYRRCLELQVREYMAFLMQEKECYRPMLWKG
jgi:CRISP-associated protein Cas1